MKDLHEWNATARLGYQNKPAPNGIACPMCKKELLDSEPNIVLTSYPPQKRVHCDECGFKGTRIA